MSDDVDLYHKSLNVGRMYFTTEFKVEESKDDKLAA